MSWYRAHELPLVARMHWGRLGANGNVARFGDREVDATLTREAWRKRGVSTLVAPVPTLARRGTSRLRVVHFKPSWPLIVMGTIFK